MRRPIVASFGLALCALVACKKTTDGPMALCASEVEGGEALETQSNNVPPEVWFALILKSFNSSFPFFSVTFNFSSILVVIYKLKDLLDLKKRFIVFFVSIEIEALSVLGFNKSFLFCT